MSSARCPLFSKETWMHAYLRKALLAVAVTGFAACRDSNSVAAVFDDSTVTADVASIAGDAIATSVETMLANEAAAVMPGAPSLASPPDNTLGFSRTRTCYDAGGIEVAGCSPMSSVRKIVTHVTVDGSRAGTPGAGTGTGTWTGAVHRIIDDTLTRNFTEATEGSRSHSASVVGHDTTTFSSETVTRTHAEASHDRVNAVTWNLPRSSNPFPVSGTVTRLDSVHATFTRNGATETRDVVRNVTVTFPADAQGNVVLKVNEKTCNLNLVTHVVSNCQ